MTDENRPSNVERCISDITECPICNEVLHDNRCLPCLHTFCQKCLKTYIKGKSKGKTLSCPVCRSEVIIPKSVSDLPRNFFIDKLIDAHKIKRKELPVGMCEICSEDAVVGARMRSTVSHAYDYAGVALATRFCCDCRQNMCLSCERQHKKIKATFMHTIIDSPSVTDSQELAPRPTYCTAHNTKVAEVYCQDCRKVICWQCKAMSHNNHGSTELSSAAKNLVKKLEEHIEEISKKIRGKQAVAQNLREHEKLYTDEIDGESANIIREYNKLYRNIAENVEKLKQALTNSSTCYLRPIRALQDQTEKEINDLQKQKVYVEQMIQLGNVSDLLEYTDKLISQTTKITSENTSTVTLRVPPVTHLSDSDLHDLLTGMRKDIDHQYRDRNLDDSDKSNNEDSQSNLMMKGQSKALDLTSNTKDWSLETTIKYGDGEAVYSGITVLNAKLYIASQSVNYILVYSLTEKSFLNSTTVDGLVNPNDVASCKFNNCLYICDWSKSRIFRVEVNEKMSQTNWSVDGDLGGLSVTTEHNVLLSGYKANTLKEYTSEGKLIRSINLDGDFKPWHAIKLASNDFLICYGDDYYNGVCLTDSNGKLIRSYGGEKGCDESHMYGPYYMAVDKNGYVLVTDCNNRRILLLSSSLKFIKAIVSSSAKVLRRARRIYLDEETGRLFVADNVIKDGITKDGKILVFSFSYA